MSLNKVMLIGFVGSTPQMRDLESGKIATFSLATSEKYKDRSGNLREDTTWHSCIAFSSMADTISRLVDKGTQIYVEGKLRNRKYTDKTGYERTLTEIVVNGIQLVGGGQSRQESDPAEGIF